MRRRVVRSVGVLTAALAFPTACASDAGAPLRHEVVTAGDTTIVTNEGTPPVTRPDTVVIVWQSPELEAPRSLVRAGDRLVVGDWTQVHVVPLDGSPPRSLGREGEGPGEFRQVASVAVAGDTIVAYDARLMRLTRMAMDGTLRGVRRVTPREPFVNGGLDATPMVPYADGVLWTRTERVMTTRPPQRAVILHDVAADSDHVVWSGDGEARRRFPSGFFGPARVWGPNAILAIARDGGVAHGDGIEYRVDVVRPDAPSVLSVRREWRRAEVADDVRDADLASVADDRERELLEEMMREQEIPELLPSYDALRFGVDGTLWVRTMGEADGRVHPVVARVEPERAPAVRRWDVFDPDGTLLRTVELSARFEPWALDVDRIDGILELESGERVIAEARFDIERGGD